MQKNIIAIVAVCCASLAPLQAMTQERLEKFLELSDYVALIQNGTHVATSAIVWPDRWFSSQNIEDMGLLMLMSQIPNDVVRMTLERNRSWLLEISQQAVLLRSLESFEDAIGAFGIKMIDTAVFNHLNQMLHTKFPSTDDQIKRRILRVLGMTIARAALCGLAHELVERTKQKTDFWGEAVGEQLQRHTLVNQLFGAVVCYHLVTETMGALLAHLIVEPVGKK